MALFGTDGVRGLANRDVTPELALALASASARVLIAHAAGSRGAEAEAGRAAGAEAGVPAGRRPLAVVGRDPRISGEMLESAVVAGLSAAGADVLRVGVLPTPAVAFLTADYDADLGVVLSASHNPMPDNGIKFFSRGGHKLPDEIEAEIEAELAAGAAQRPTGADIGRVRHAEPEAAQRYLDHLLRAVPTVLHRPDGTPLTVVVDGANGAAATVGPELYRRAGATVIEIHCSPDGLNINQDCGSTHLADVIAAVREHGADLGIAHDGDADRTLAVAADGTVVDGDAILAICALALHEAGELAAGTVVATVMSNLGFHHAMRDAGITVATTGVGDRYVLEALRAGGLSLGGEQSGHVVFTAAATTGDGLLTALHLMARMALTGRSLGELAAVVRRLPQTLVNVPVRDKATVAASASVARAVAEAQGRLGDAGRVLLRPSGTENLVRVMVEASTEQLAEQVAEQLAEVVRGA